MYQCKDEMVCWVRWDLQHEGRIYAERIASEWPQYAAALARLDAPVVAENATTRTGIAGKGSWDDIATYLNSFGNLHTKVAAIAAKGGA